MQSVIHFITAHLDNIFVPLCGLYLFRLIVLTAELRKTAGIRRKKGVFHSVRAHYTEFGAELGLLLGGVLVLLLPQLWFLFFLVMIALGILGGKLGRSRGTEMDEIYREAARDLKQQAEAEAAREAAAHTLESGEERGDEENPSPNEKL